ncbi:MAG: glycoside hydrolase family 10 protein [Oscillospiraceae bacterium]
MKRIKCAALCFMLLLCGCSAAGNESSSSLLIVDAGGASIADNVFTQISTVTSATERTTITQVSHNSQPEYSESEHTDSTAESEPYEQTSQPIVTSQTSTETTVSTTSASATQTTAETIETTAAVTSTTTTTQSEPADEPVVIETGFEANDYRALNYSEVKAVWISYIELAQLLTGKSESEFRNSIGTAFDNCVSLGLNTVYIHARSHSDAYYSSELYPWSKYVTGTLNCAPSFDPLKIMVEEAHSRKLSIHAWINPLRACAVTQLNSYGDYPVGKWARSDSTAGKYVVDVNGTYYLNPAYEPVIDLIAQGAAEIVSGYDVDGVHIDDYFYPTTDASFDSSAFSSSGYSTISSFRFANCDKLVSAIYSAVKSANSTALFGVSCQGSVENNYNQMYADVKKWCETAGYLDYIAPQIYYGFTNSAQPYERCLSQWNDIAKSGGIPLIAGLSVSKIGYEDTWAGEGKYEWINDKNIISRQINAAMECTAYGGTALYSYRSIFLPESAVKAQVETEITAVKKLYTE